LYNKQHESVQRFDQLFLMADTSKVYAVVNAPEQILTQLRKGLPAIFVRPDGERYMGVVARISKPIDPSSKTKRVHVLINNAASKLEMGMLGAVRLMGEKE
jgi:multidrug efflux pump subunit AcrA (membrane-fusion protein)